MHKLILIIAALMISLSGFGQEFNCQVQVNHSQVQGTDTRVYETMQSAIYEFINSRKWSNNTIKMEERIECTILITISERLGADVFRGSVNLVLRRPVLNTAYNTNLLNYVDKDFTINYVEYQPLDYSDGAYASNLTSFLAYYIYMFLGLEFDSFAPYGGTAYFQKAQDVVQAAQNAQESGWKGYESTRNRYWLVENFLNPSNSALRDFMYQYHRNGLDMMYEKVDQGRSVITESLNYLKSTWDAKPDLMALQIIIDAKRDELVNIYSDQRVAPMEKTTVANILKEIDPANSSKYQSIIQGN